MVQISGKYEVVESKNFYELLTKMGAPEEHAKRSNDEKVTVEVSFDGNKIKFITGSKQDQVSELVLNQEVDEKLSTGKTAKSTATLNGNVLTVKTKGPESTHSTRVFTFTDTGGEMKVISTKGDVTAEASRIYKRI